MQTLKVRTCDGLIEISTSFEAEHLMIEVKPKSLPHQMFLTHEDVQRLIQNLQLADFVQENNNLDLEEAKRRFLIESEDKDSRDPEPEEYTWWE